MNGMAVTAVGIALIGSGTFLVYYGQHLLKHQEVLATRTANAERLERLSQEINHFVRGRTAAEQSDLARQFEARFWDRIVLLRDKIGRDYAEGDGRLNEEPRDPDGMLAIAEALEGIATRLRRQR